MEREMKFRAISQSTGEFEYGNLLKSEANAIGEYFVNIARRFAFDPNVIQISCVSGTEGQYTGLKDKNGIEIFEGDLIEQFMGKKQSIPVVFDNGCFMCKEEPLGYDFGIRYDHEESMLYLPHHWAVVVGNIHQNPELV